MMSGGGRYKFIAGSVQEGSAGSEYWGQCVADGYGRLATDNGCVYEGQWERGRQVGGVYTLAAAPHAQGPLGRGGGRGGGPGEELLEGGDQYHPRVYAVTWTRAKDGSVAGSGQETEQDGSQYSGDFSQPKGGRDDIAMVCL